MDVDLPMYFNICREFMVAWIQLNDCNSTIQISGIISLILYPELIYCLHHL